MGPSSPTDAASPRWPRRAFYRGLTWLTLPVAPAMAVLAAIAFALGQPLAGGAAIVCGLSFFVPGLFFLNETRRILLRDAALAHAGEVAQARGVADAATLAEELGVPKSDAEKIIRKAIREGHAQGIVDAEGRFVATDAPRCPACRRPLARRPAPRTCPACGAIVVAGG